MSQIRKNDHRLMQILLGPIVSEKAIIKKANQSALADLRDDAITQRRPMSI
jgi:large subunit ribosomal protein L23